MIDDTEIMKTEAAGFEPGSESLDLGPDAPRRALRYSMILLALLTVAAGCLTFREARQWNDDRQDADRRSASVEVATNAALGLSTLNATSVKQQMDDLIAMSTGEFRKQLKASKSSQAASVRKTKLVAKGTVDAAGVVRFDSETAVVAVALTSRVTDMNHPKPKTNLYRVTAKLEWKEGTWLVSSLEFVQ